MSDNRVPVTARLTPQGLAEIDRMADDEERDRSSMIRLLLREAVATRIRQQVLRDELERSEQTRNAAMPVGAGERKNRRTVTQKEQV